MPHVVAPVVRAPEVGNRWEPLCERYKRQHPPIFEGGPDPLKVEQWMSMITSIMDFMRVEGNDRVPKQPIFLERMPVFGARWHHRLEMFLL